MMEEKEEKEKPKLKYRVSWAVWAIIDAKNLDEAKAEAEKIAERNKWELNGVEEDNPDEDAEYEYPDHVQELLNEERRRLS